MSTKEYLQYVAVSDPAGFLNRYMTSNPTITVGSTSYALTVGSVTVNGVSNNALGYKVGNKFTTLTQQQIQRLADDALTLAKNSTDTTAMSNDLTAYTNLTNDIKRLIASNWFVSETLAKYDPKTKTYNNGKSAVGDSYLATITTVLENSLTTPNGQQILWAGGRGSGVLKKLDPRITINCTPTLTGGCQMIQLIRTACTGSPARKGKRITAKVPSSTAMPVLIGGRYH